MSHRFNRTIAAVLLTAAAIIVPCTAWYIVGSNAARTDAQELVDQPLRHAYKVSMRMAERLGSRLETMRDSESRRPFYHYQEIYHDPTSSCECASVTPSPLSTGPTDPLVLAHFQIDPSHRVTLPTLGSDPNEGGEWYCAQQSIQTALEDVALTCVEAVVWPSGSKGLTAKQSYGEVSESGLVVEDWTLATEPRDIKSVDEFSWHSVELEEGTSLVALRRVFTDHGEWVQGFLISFRAVRDLLQDSPFAVHVLPGPVFHSSQSLAEVVIPIEAAEWKVSVDAGDAVAEAERKGEVILASFHRSFVGGASAAAIAGLCVIWLVWQTDKLARQRSRFAASAAHELRTPLAGMRLYGEMLAEGLGDPNRGSEYARRISAESERLGRVVSNVLGYSRLERGSLTVKSQRGDLSAAVGECLERLRPTLEAAGARLKMSLTEGLPQAWFDTDAVHQIVQNLVDNAEKYSRSASDRTIHVEVGHNSHGIELAVRDHGQGVPKKIQRHLFRPFQRGGDPDAPSGLGLGLVLVENLATAQGARVRYEDASGGGARFSVIFPEETVATS